MYNMPKIYSYNSLNAVNYAQQFAFLRNGNYYNFDNLGGDCTNYCSQCLLAGSNNVMNREFNPKWYYNSVSDRSPSWTGVEFLFQYLIQNKNKGPFAKLVKFNEVQIGDIVQLKFAGNINFSHCLVITKLNERVESFNDIFVCAHTIDSLNRPLSNYRFVDIRFLSILGVYN